jgi:hypothetical protein
VWSVKREAFKLRRAKSAGMWMVSAALVTATLFVLTSCVAVGSQPITYSVTPGREDATVTYQVNGGDVMVDVHSKSGIGSAQLAQTGGIAPTSLTMRLYLKGLEQFTFQYPAATVTAAVSSHDGSVSESVTIQGGAAQPIGPDSPYWMPVKIGAADTSIPLQDGYFETQAPKDFLTSESREFTLHWVDFYR